MKHHSRSDVSDTLRRQSRRSFLQRTGAILAAATLGFKQNTSAQETPVDPDISKGWKPISDRKIRMGLIGYGYAKFGAEFGFEKHPNVNIVAVSDLVPERCAELAKVTRCAKTYPSLEDLVKDDDIEAVFIATDAPHHAQHCLEALKHGKHVATAVPAVWGSLEEAESVFEAVKKSGLKYMMFETSSFHPDLFGMRQIYNAGGLGKLVYAEGEYYHYMEQPLDSYKGWRIGLPPQFYPTHSNAYYVCVTGGSFIEVSCVGVPSIIEHLKPANNSYNNRFGTEIAFLRTSEGGIARMAVSWDTPGAGDGDSGVTGGVTGRVRGQRGSYFGQYDGLESSLPSIKRPPLPPGVPPGGHEGSHGYLMSEFVAALLEDRKPLVDVAMALNLTVAGIVAHQSALKDGEWMKIPQFKI
jgi:predicted dehydrogenase